MIPIFKNYHLKLNNKKRTFEGVEFKVVYMHISGDPNTCQK